MELGGQSGGGDRGRAGEDTVGGGLGQTLYTCMKYSINKKEQPVIK